MNKIIEIQDSVESAKHAKETFEDNYIMYCDWCAQFGTATNKITGEKAECIVIPQSEEVWNSL